MLVNLRAEITSISTSNRNSLSCGGVIDRRGRQIVDAVVAPALAPGGVDGDRAQRGGDADRIGRHVGGREVDGKVLDFDHCGYVYQGSFVMFDKQTESEWLHATAECVMGPLKGKTLEMEPTRLITWKEWKALSPQTTVMATRRKWNSKSYERKDFAKADSRPKLGLNVVVQQHSKLYPYSVLETKKVINDSFQETPLVVVFVPRAACALAWVRTVDAKALTFEPSTGDGKRLRLRDKETSSVWDPLNGIALSGPHKGKQLKPLIAIPIRRSRYRGLYPDGKMYSAESKIKPAASSP